MFKLEIVVCRFSFVLLYIFQCNCLFCSNQKWDFVDFHLYCCVFLNIVKISFVKQFSPQPRKPPEAIRKRFGRGRLHFLFDPSFVTAAGSHRKLCGSRPEGNVNKDNYQRKHIGNVLKLQCKHNNCLKQ